MSPFKPDPEWYEKHWFSPKPVELPSRFAGLLVSVAVAVLALWLGIAARSVGWEHIKATLSDVSAPASFSAMNAAPGCWRHQVRLPAPAVCIDLGLVDQVAKYSSSAADGVCLAARSVCRI